MSKPPIVAIGEVVEGRYKILKVLGEGGMSTVFLAEHWLIKRRVAMKILHSEYASDADMIRRFMNEALAAGTLGHPNIVESTDMGFTRTDVPYIVYEYVEGTLLSDEIYRVMDMGPRRALKIAHQIASALEAAHDAGIVHRDLKSDNVFLTKRGDLVDQVKVLDFGISRFLAASDRTALGGTVMGTPEFMAPEQVTSPDSVDKRADIYALGIVLYEMLAGRLPYRLGQKELRTDISAMHALLHRIINEPPPPLTCHDGPPGLAAMIVNKLLAKDPDKRYQSMKDVQNAIDAFTSVMPPPSGFIVPADRASTEPPNTQPRSLELEQLSDQTLSRSLLDPTLLAREVKQLGKRWELDGSLLRLEFFSRSMAKLARVVSHASAIADELDHQPDIEIDHPKLTITIHAYDDKSITVLDLVFAARIEQWLRDHDW